MSDVTPLLRGKKASAGRRVEAAGSAAPTWWLILKRELADLWVGGKALTLILIYTVLLGFVTYVIATNSELSLIPPKEMVYETLKIAMAVSLFIGLILGADSLSGDRERATLETLLLTPASRRQVVAGKFLAGLSPWPLALAVTIPYMNVLSQGDEVFGQAVVWGAILGSVLAPAYVAVGMLVSFFCNTNKSSYLVSLGIYILLLVPAQLPGRAQTGEAGQWLQLVNPVAAANHFLSKVLVNNRTLAEFWPWLRSPAIFAVLVVALLFWYAAPGLRLEGGRSSRFWSSWGRRLLGGLSVPVALSLLLSVALGASPALASEAGDLQIAIDMDHTVVKAGDPIFYNTRVTNTGTAAAPPLVVAMNIINLDAQGEIVDPEDWSPERTQYVESLAPGQSAELAWRVNAILDGDYMVYMVVIPTPAGTEATSLPVASSGIHLTVTPFTRLNPGGVLPYAIGGPLVLLLGILVVYRLRRRSIDVGDAS